MTDDEAKEFLREQCPSLGVLYNVPMSGVEPSIWGAAFP
jgi:hypothetical protein